MTRPPSAPTPPSEGERYTAYVLAEEARLRREIAQTEEAGVQELLGSLIGVLRAYERSVQIGVYTCEQAQGQYRFKLSAMRREFGHLDREVARTHAGVSFTGSVFPRAEALVPTLGLTG